jgi:type IV pilus assembly protein PilC
MPFFRWHGIDLQGNDQYGTLIARSTTELDSRLFSQDIALLSCTTTYPRAARSINFSSKAALFNHLATLLKAGIYVDQALELVMLQENSQGLQDVLRDIFLDVHHGNSLSTSLKQYPTIFDSLSVQIIEAGQAAGCLPHALQALAHYYEELIAFRKQLSRALTMPIITAAFFLFVALIIFIVIMPTFSWLFASFNQELPSITRLMLSLSEALRSWTALILVVACIGVSSLGLYWYRRQKQQCIWLTRCLWRLPLIGSLLQKIHICRFFQSLALLLEGGVSIKPALETVQVTINNPLLLEQLQKPFQAVLAGMPLHEALVSQPSLFGPETLAYMRIGQETGTLGHMMARTATLYQQTINKQLSTITTIIQPLLMIILGLWIALLIIAVYLPIFTLSYAIS